MRLCYVCDFGQMTYPPLPMAESMPEHAEQHGKFYCLRQCTSKRG